MKSFKFVPRTLYMLNLRIRGERFTAEWEFIKTRGSRLHFYENHRGIDIMITKQEAIDALQTLSI